MIVLGIDPGAAATGYGVIAGGTRPRVLASGVLRTDAARPLAERLRAIHEGVLEILDRHAPQEMAVESLFNRNARASLVLGHARGVVLLAAALRGVPVAEYAPREIKKALTGNGAAAKEQVRFMVCRCCELAAEPRSLDESDAIAVALCHAGRRPPARLRPAGGLP